MRRLACSGLCALAPILAAAQPAATTAAASWSVQPSPNVRTFSNFLAGVTATGVTAAMLRPYGYSQEKGEGR